MSDVRIPGSCWCRHAHGSHRPWANGEFCTNEGCGCRHFSESSEVQSKCNSVEGGPTDYGPHYHDGDQVARLAPGLDPIEEWGEHG